MNVTVTGSRIFIRVIDSNGSGWVIDSNGSG